jgi:AraC-like DNA-binding protein
VNGVARIAGPELDTQVTKEVRVRGWQMEHAATMRAGAHAALEVAWPESGGLTYAIGSDTLDVPVGCAVVVPVAVEHKTSVRDGTRAGSLWLDAAMVAEIADAIAPRGGLQPVARVIGDATSVIALGRLLLAEGREAPLGRSLAAGALAEALVVQVLRDASSKSGAAGGRDPRIAAAVERVRVCYSEPLTVEALARTAHMSRFHFSRRFREEIGVSPYRFLQSVRVAEAAALLRRGTHSVTEAALTVGFSDLGRFAQAFRREIGCAPSSFQRTHGRAHVA